MRNHNSSALTVMLAVGLLGMAVGPSSADDKSIFPPFKLDVTLDSHLTVNGQPPGPKVTAVPIAAKLTNSSLSVAHLKSNGCLHVYSVVDAATKVVVEPFPEMCSMILRTLDLAPAKSTSGTHQLQIDGTKLKDGGKYILHYSFWGVAADVPFSVTVTQ